MTSFRRALLRSVAVIAAVGANALAIAPAHAGGPGTTYVYGDTYSQCTANLNAAIKVLRANGYQVTGIESCRKTGDGKRWFGEYVVN